MRQPIQTINPGNPQQEPPGNPVPEVPPIEEPPMRPPQPEELPPHEPDKPDIEPPSQPDEIPPVEPPTRRTMNFAKGQVTMTAYASPKSALPGAQPRLQVGNLMKRSTYFAIYLSLALGVSACSSCRDDPYAPPDELPVDPEIKFRVQV